MKLYTKTGDAGTTALYGGERVRKDDLRVRAYGSVDEANAAIGLARALLENRDPDADLAEIQNALFDLGADLATPAGSRYRENFVPLDEQDVAAVEAMIDRYDHELEALKAFVLPGGHPASAALHLARTVVRRAEREVVALAAAEEVNPQVPVFLNRLSDLMFVLARTANVHGGVSETRWQVRGRSRRAPKGRTGG